jgi:hypothetical protein
MIEFSLSYSAATIAAFIFMIFVWSLAFGFYAAGYARAASLRNSNPAVNQPFPAPNDSVSESLSIVPHDDQGRSPHQSEYLTLLAERISESGSKSKRRSPN